MKLILEELYLWDDYALRAPTQPIEKEHRSVNWYSPARAAKDAAEYADAMIVERRKRMGD